MLLYQAATCFIGHWQKQDNKIVPETSPKTDKLVWFMLNLSANELDGKPAWSPFGKIGFPPSPPPTAHYSWLLRCRMET